MQHIHWLLLVAALLHVMEEYSLGFLPWFRRAIPALAPAMTPRWALLINAGFLALCLASALATHAPPVLRMSIPALLLLNAALHAGMTLRMREYSPGLVSAMLLYLPLGIAALRHELATRHPGTPDIVGAAVLALAIHALAPLSLRLTLPRR